MKQTQAPGGQNQGSGLQARGATPPPNLPSPPARDPAADGAMPMGLGGVGRGGGRRNRAALAEGAGGWCWLASRCRKLTEARQLTAQGIASPDLRKVPRR